MSPSTSSTIAKLKKTTRYIPTEILGESLLRVMDSSEDRDGTSFLQLVVEDARSVAIERASLRHCVRCHSDYYLKRNTNDACQIPHVFDAEDRTFTGNRSRWGEKEYQYTARCCSGSTLVEESEFEYKLEDTEPRFCFSGRHTTDVRDVRYHRYSVLKCKKDEVGRCLRQPRGPKYEPIFTDSPEYPDSDGVAADGFQEEYEPEGFEEDEEDEEDEGDPEDKAHQNGETKRGENGQVKERPEDGEEEIDELDEEDTQAQIVVEKRRRRR
ncbi:hypothetical protein BU17DRAFT_71321 [Hysterangium stoloniferum]|nr:hypothetical protein BU17DRAFT_71321 [Hysterangium stoloniferum]